VIVTITLFGKVIIELLDDPESKKISTHLPVERLKTAVFKGNAYAIWSKARWKALHNAIVEPSEPAIPGLVNGVARVGLTFRYVRRSFLQLAAPSRSPEAPPLQPLDVVDAMVYERGQRKEQYLYTYPAIVLHVDFSLQELVLHYVGDGLVADSNEEAFCIAEGVPMQDATRASPAVVEWVNDQRAPWTICTYKRVQLLHERGAEAILQEWRMHGRPYQVPHWDWWKAEEGDL
jgi:hypothetical protein